MELKKFLGAALLGVAVAACAGADEGADAQESAAAEAPVVAEGQTPAAATGNVIEIRMLDENGVGKFEPAEVTAKQGDVLRYTLATGVHNVSFPADRNAGKSALPAAGQYLTSPGQTYDVPVTMAAGEYTFQCDPHAAMGMVGKLTVQ